MREIVKIISEKQVQEILTEDDVIRQVENTWRWYGEGRVIMPSKITLDMEPLGVHGWFNSMPSYISETGYAGIKFVGGFSENKTRGMPFIRAKLMIFDPSNGMMKALVAGDWISEYRTGAQPAIACKYLASATEVVTIIGAGQMARASLTCMQRMLNIGQVRICDQNPEARRSFAAQFKDTPFTVTEYEDNREACLGSDVIITITTADAPLVKGDWIKEGALVLTMGSFMETALDVVTGADRLIADHIGQSLHRGNFKPPADKGLITADSFSASLPEVICGAKEGRKSEKDRVLCQLVGMGAPDAACAALVLKRIEEENIQVPELDLGD